MSAAVAVALTAACGGPTTGGSTPSAAATAGSSGAAKVPLTVYSAQGYDSDVVKAFTKATGINVKLVDDSTGPLLTKIAAERNNAQWGLLWVDGDTAFAALDKQGQLLPYTPSATLTDVGQQIVPSDHAYVPTGTTVMAALIYNAAKVTNVPTSYQDLLTPAYKGLVGMNDPSQSGPTYPFIAGVMNQLGGQADGVAKGEDFFTQLKKNGLHVNPTNGDTLHALETGQIQYGLIQSSAATGEILKAQKSATFDPKVVYLPKSTLLPSVIGVDKAAPPAEQAEAKQFIDFVLSPAGQKVMQGADATGDSLFWPVVPGVTALSGLSAFPTDFQKIDPYFWGPLEGQVNSWFDGNIK
ncbi:extracellular solute-binding protein [Frankia sp. AgB1.9]|uniref:ABC transporter substrate-binding protein n=1 Tax=unclassified Frankia TaxID=2632575 RepID=UPI0019329F6F|nr:MULTISPECIES: extracellular solute-binding protein [unclassified Frankia]MBL7488583.1 extracellular solute-binding protein [Frankia sp. AgW1.1]MBL7550617.1 extracellular solute-binding protein [Frankia sp. AgB1.9]MBL7619790.1 extracellular solute-binding protein [Frankia sp. AgB1.8]